MSAKSRPAEVPAAANASETAFWEITPGEGRNLATVSGQKCVRGRAKERARCPIGVQRPPSAPHDVRLGGTPWPHRVRRLLARRSGRAPGRWAHEDGRRGAARSRASLGDGGGTPEMNADRSAIGDPAGHGVPKGYC